MRNELALDLWFPTPIWNVILDVDDKITEDLTNLCFRLKEESRGVNRSNIGGWHSNPLYLKDFDNTPFQHYFAKIEPYLQDVSNVVKANKRFFLEYFWVNINGKNHYNAEHYHPSSFLSGALYLTDNNSPINFKRDKDITLWMLDYVGAESSNAITYRSAHYTPKKNSLLLFPSWLEHSVDPNPCEQPRISLSFNIGVQ